MKKFEYHKEYFSHIVERYEELDLDKLNNLGQEGWELISVISGECIFKREIQ